MSKQIDFTTVSESSTLTKEDVAFKERLNELKQVNDQMEKNDQHIEHASMCKHVTEVEFSSAERLGFRFAFTPEVGKKIIKVLETHYKNEKKQLIGKAKELMNKRL